MIYEEDEVTCCKFCGGNLVRRTMMWYGKLTKRLKCLKCGHIY